MRRIVLALVVLGVWMSWGGVQAQSPPWPTNAAFIAGLTRPSTLTFAAVQTATGPTVTASWTANPVADLVVDYRLYYGTAPATYTATPLDIAAPAVSAAVPGLTPGITYYFALQARAAVLLSALSTEVAFTVPTGTDPTCTPPLGANAIAIFPTTPPGLTGSQGGGSRAHLDFQIGSPNSLINYIAIQSHGVNIDPGTDGVAVAGVGGNLTNFGSLWFTIPAVSGTYPLSILATNVHGCSQVQSTAFSVTVP